jgi:hypothetical protein
VDQGSEFKCEHFEHVWCQANNILPRFGAVGQHGSIAVVERFHRTLKELLRLTTIPEDQTAFERELELIIDWYNEHRPHETLDGKTHGLVNTRIVSRIPTHARVGNRIFRDSVTICHCCSYEISGTREPTFSRCRIRHLAGFPCSKGMASKVFDMWISLL